MYEILFSTRHNYHPRSPLKLTQVMWTIKANHHHYFLYPQLTPRLLSSGAWCHTGNLHDIGVQDKCETENVILAS